MFLSVANKIVSCFINLGFLFYNKFIYKKLYIDYRLFIFVTRTKRRYSVNSAYQGQFDYVPGIDNGTNSISRICVLLVVFSQRTQYGSMFPQLNIRRIALCSPYYYYYRSLGEGGGDYWRSVRRDAEFCYYRCCYLCYCYSEDSSAKSLRRVWNSQETGGLRGCGETREIEKKHKTKQTTKSGKKGLTWD